MNMNQLKERIERNAPKRPANWMKLSVALRHSGRLARRVEHTFSKDADTLARYERAKKIADTHLYAAYTEFGKCETDDYLMCEKIW